jgi:hypothetical protein
VSSGKMADKRSAKKKKKKKNFKSEKLTKKPPNKQKNQKVKFVELIYMYALVNTQMQCCNL